MLGNEALSLTATYVEVGDHLYTATHVGGDKVTYYGSGIVEIAPSADPWLPEALDLRLDNGQTVTVAPHDWVTVIADERLYAARMRRVNAARRRATEVDEDSPALLDEIRGGGENDEKPRPAEWLPAVPGPHHGSGVDRPQRR